MMTYECPLCSAQYFHELDARICSCEANRKDLEYWTKLESEDDRGDVVGWSDGDIDEMDAAYEHGDMGGWAREEEEDYPDHARFYDQDPASLDEMLLIDELHGGEPPFCQE